MQCCPYTRAAAGHPERERPGDGVQTVWCGSEPSNNPPPCSGRDTFVNMDTPEADLANREREYSPSSMIGGDLTAVIARYVDGSAETRRRFPPVAHAYGPGADELLDVYQPTVARNGEMHVFLHGGYWQELSRHESSFHIQPLLDRGCAVAVPDFTLAPHASLDAIVDQCVRAVRWCIENLPATRIMLSGSSAGAHLAAMVLTVESRIDAAVLLSGVYELGPLIGTYINDAVGITVESASRLSPVRLAPARPIPIVVADGEIETATFHEQSDAFAARWAAHGSAIARVTVVGRNHFDVPEELNRLVPVTKETQT
jgi:arylformamidase